MRPVGFSTGAVALSNVRLAVSLLNNEPVQAIEISAIRIQELEPTLQALSDLDLGRFSYISIHAPSRFDRMSEAHVFQALYEHRSRGWAIVVHPDTLHDLSLWRRLGELLCIENMDNRKRMGRTAQEMKQIFSELPDATFCLDLGHARQIDSSMTEAYLMIKGFASRLRQIHISEVNARSKHDHLSFVSILDYQEVAGMIAESVPAIIESVVEPNQIGAEIARVRRALSRRS
jgi:hypothetical protein